MMLYTARSHIGLVRQMNQDGYAVMPHLSPRQLFVVADGMGGPSAGEVASRIAVDVLTSYMEQYGHRRDIQPTELLREAIYHANQKIYTTAQENPNFHGMGTTVVCTLLDEEVAFFAHVGDSRGYIFQNGKLTQITKDHSLVAELVRRGQLTEEEARIHPQRNIVTRSLGTEAHSDPDIDKVEWSKGDVILLCSDGLSNLITHAELQVFLQQVAQAIYRVDLEDIADQMIRLALERGGPDNITLVFVLHGEEGETGE